MAHRIPPLTKDQIGALHAHEEMTQTEVAQILGVSKQAIFQTERKALKKLKVECERRGLTYESLFG